MYYHYIIMDNQPTIRTQISLTSEIKKAIEAKKRLTGESMSAYLRKAAMIRILAEEEEKKQLKMLAKNFVGAGQWKKEHLHWKSKSTTYRWLRKLRSSWEEP